MDALMQSRRNRTGELSQQFIALAALEGLGLIPGTNMASRSHLYLQFQGVRSPLLTSADTGYARTYVQAKLSYIATK